MKGVARVRIVGYHGVDHFVCVDANARKKYDDMEEKPLKLCVDALKACCGDDSDLDQIVECRKLTVYRRSTKEKRTRRGLSEGRKRNAREPSTTEFYSNAASVLGYESKAH